MTTIIDARHRFERQLQLPLPERPPEPAPPVPRDVFATPEGQAA